MISLREFINCMNVLTSIDKHELVDAGVIETDEAETWRRFRDDPYRWLVHADDFTQIKVWRIIELRSIGARS